MAGLKAGTTDAGLKAGTTDAEIATYH